MHRLTKVFLMLSGIAMTGCVHAHSYDRYEPEYRYRHEAPRHHHGAHRYESRDWRDHERREYREHERERRHERSEDRDHDYRR